jgi:GMP synthase (glutamine-hydrolysing)
MNIHYLQHVPFEDLGSIEDWAKIHGHRVTETRLYQGETPPSPNDLNWLIIMGGPMNIYEEDTYPWFVHEKRFIEEVIKTGKVVLGICLGAQLIADVLGVRIYENIHKEIGWFPIQLTNEGINSSIFRGIPSGLEVFHWHGDTFALPHGAIRIARSAACENQAFVYDNHVIALQFHLETTRRNAEQLITHCGNELVEAPFIQPSEAMLSNELRFKKVNEAMSKLLDQLEHLDQKI